MGIDKLIKKYEEKSRIMKIRGPYADNPEYRMEYQTTIKLVRAFINELKKLKK